MSNLILLVGPPGCGKSTFCYDYPNYVRISQDDQGKDGHARAFLNAIEKSQDIIVDRMNFNKEQRNRYLVPAKNAGYVTRIIVLHESSKVCLQRMSLRQNHPTIKTEENALAALQTFFTKYERVEDCEADIIDRVWPKREKTPAIVSDIDNTLADATHREHFVNGPGKKDWKSFFDKMGEDKSNQWCVSILDLMSGKFDILLTSARPDDYREVTTTWLFDNHVYYDKLIMRRKGDYRKDDIVKEILYEFEIKSHYDVLFWIDDRKQVIDKIRSHGIVVLDCAGPKGNF